MCMALRAQSVHGQGCSISQLLFHFRGMFERL